MSALPLISHRMLVSALPHELANESQDSPGIAQTGSEAPAINAEAHLLTDREFSDVVARDDAAFNTRTPQRWMTGKL